MELEWATSSALRERSKQVFGQELRLALCLYIGREPDGLFTITRAADALRVAPSALQAPLANLLRAEHVRPAVRREGSREKWLSRSESILWQFAEELATTQVRGQMTLTFE